MKSETASVLSALLADSLALGPHWIYEPDEIAGALDSALVHHAPLSPYHRGKHAGDLTHYGDQTLLLLRSLVEAEGWYPEHFAARWMAFWSEPDTLSYRDSATRATLDSLRGGMAPSRAGSTSQDLGGAARIPPLLLLPWPDADALADAARSQTALTHDHPQVLEAAEFFARLGHALLAGRPLAATLAELADSGLWRALPAAWFESAASSAASTLPDEEALAGFGLGCGVEAGFRGVCHLLLRHPDDPRSGLSSNFLAGGDSAARGLLLGMTYGAAGRMEPLLDELLPGLRALPQIQSLLARFHTTHETQHA